ncbi:DUF397 domain-containing protein [Streptomyces sp. CC224B]|uniref:DUF397 domain-containing protein n=1 Tax=Streptomyces sp. CC224B TaxID=3044571 RepID=UPI0024A97F8A|nr:DUF397 domain-containing protein [Streptomyces sp. CC224B]
MPSARTTLDASGTPENLDWTRAVPEGDAGSSPWIEIAFGPDSAVSLRETSDPDTVNSTTRKKWDAFVLGARTGDFDHFLIGDSPCRQLVPLT